MDPSRTQINQPAQHNAAQGQQQAAQLWSLGADLAQGGGQAAPTQQHQAQQQQGMQPATGQQMPTATGMTTPTPQQNAPPKPQQQQRQPQSTFGLQAPSNQPPQSSRQPPSAAGTQAIQRDPEPAPYGLVLELGGGGGPQQQGGNPLDTRPMRQAAAGPRVAKRPLSGGLSGGGAGYVAMPPGAIPQQQHPPQHAGPASSSYSPGAAAYAGAVMHEQEPDYGFLAELRQPAPDVGGAVDAASAHDFGLAAEVARRRGGAPLPLGGRYGSTSGSSLRPRKRLAASGPPADFGMSRELAEKQAQMERDRLDPFNSANRASNHDPFVMADDLLKFPTKPYEPEAPQQQVRGEGREGLCLAEIEKMCTQRCLSLNSPPSTLFPAGACGWTGSLARAQRRIDRRREH